MDIRDSKKVGNHGAEEHGGRGTHDETSCRELHFEPGPSPREVDECLRQGLVWHDALVEAQRRAERLREAHLVHVYEGDSTIGCGICQCTWEPGAVEVHDADCLAAPEKPAVQP